MRAFSHFGVAEVAVELIQPRQPEVGAVSSLFGRLDSRADNRKTISAQTRGLNSAPTKSGFLLQPQFLSPSLVGVKLFIRISSSPRFYNDTDLFHGCGSPRILTGACCGPGWLRGRESDVARRNRMPSDAAILALDTDG